MQRQQPASRAGHDRVGAPFIIAEFHQHGFGVELFRDSAHLPACEPLSGNIGQQSYHVQSGRLGRSLVCPFHHSTQQVTKRGSVSRGRTIQTVLTMARRSCRATATSSCERVPQESDARCDGSPERGLRAVSRAARKRHPAEARAHGEIPAPCAVPWDERGSGNSSRFFEYREPPGRHGANASPWVNINTTVRGPGTHRSRLCADWSVGPDGGLAGFQSNRGMGPIEGARSCSHTLRVTERGASGIKGCRVITALQEEQEC